MDKQNEQIIILNALDCYFDQLSQSCNVLTGEEKGELRLYQQSVLSIRKHLFVDAFPITEQDNNVLIRSTCPVCRHGGDRPGTPYWAFSDGQPVCSECLVELAPDIHQQVNQKNDEYWKINYQPEENEQPESLPF